MKTVLVLNPVLNFVSRCMTKGIKTDMFVNKGIEFFDHASIMEAKKLLWTYYEVELGYEERLRECKKDCDNLTDIAKAIWRCAKDGKELPTFVILEPESVPTCGDEIAVCITTKVNEMTRKMDSELQQFSRKLDTLNNGLKIIADSKNQPTASSSVSKTPNVEKQLFSVVVKNMPPELDDPGKRKDFITSLAPGDTTLADAVLRRRNKEWQLSVSSKQAAEKVSAALKISHKIDNRLVNSQFIGIVKRLPSNVTEDLLKNLSKDCEKAIKCGNSQAFKMYYPSKSALSAALTNPIKIGFELFRLEEFCFLPRRCYRCHHVGHIAADCKEAETCSRCGETGHTSSPENPCQNPTRCLNCNSTRHTCYYYACPDNRKNLKDGSRSQNV